MATTSIRYEAQDLNSYKTLVNAIAGKTNAVLSLNLGRLAIIATVPEGSEKEFESIESAIKTENLDFTWDHSLTPTESDFEALISERDSLRDKIEELKKEAGELSDDLQKALVSKENKIKELTGSLETAKTLQDYYCKGLTRLQKQMDAIVLIIETLNNN